MKAKKIYTLLIVFSIVAFVSNMILVGFDFDSKAFDIDLRLLKFSSNIDELVHAIVSLAIVISIFFLLKTRISLLVSFCLTAIAEIIRFLSTIIYYDGIFDYTSNMMCYNLLAILLLVIIAGIVIKSKKHYGLLMKLSAIITILYLILYFEPVIFFDAYINLSLVLYYVSTYVLFGLIGKYLKQSESNIINS